MICINVRQIPDDHLFDFDYLSRFIADCLACGKRMRSTKFRELHICKHCGSDRVCESPRGIEP